MKKFSLLTVLTVLTAPAYAADPYITKGTSDSLSAVVGGAERVNIDTSGNVSVTGNITTVAPTADLHSATKKYVDDEIAGLSGAAGGGVWKPVWQGLSTSSTNGQMSHLDATTGYTRQAGYTSMLRTCQYKFPGSRPLHLSDLPYVIDDMPSTQIWVHDDIGANTNNQGELNCGGWTSSSSSSYGTRIYFTERIVASASCNNSYNIGCVKDVAVAADTNLMTVDSSGNISTTGTITATGTATVATPTANNHAATKAYVDTAVASASGGGGIDWTDCEAKNICKGERVGNSNQQGSQSGGISCSSGKVLVASTCSMAGSYEQPAEHSCYISGVNSVYVTGYSSIYQRDWSRVCGSIKCCATK